MRKIMSVLVALVVFVSLSSIARADCESDCRATWNTCLKHCSDSSCHANCYRGYLGCKSRCESQSYNTGTEGKEIMVAQNECKTITVTYVCGTEQKCEQMKIMDSYTSYHYETVCVDVEKYCTRTETVCP